MGRCSRTRRRPQARFADGKVRDTLYFTLQVGGCSASAIRKGGWKLVLNHCPGRNRGDDRPPLELFRMYDEDGAPDDLSEKKNLADTHPAKRDELLADLSAWFKEHDAQLPYKNAKPIPATKALPGAEDVPAVTALSSDRDVLKVSFETGKGKSKVLSGIFVYTTNGSDLLRDSAGYEEWFRVPVTVGDGFATAVAPPGMTHGIFCLRDENNFLIRSKETPPYIGEGGDRRFTIAKSPEDTYAWKPGLISLVKTGVSALKNARAKGLATGVLSRAIRVAEVVVRKPIEELAYAAMMRNLRYEITQLDVPEAELPVLNLFISTKWSSPDPPSVAPTEINASARGNNKNPDGMLTRGELPERASVKD